MSAGEGQKEVREVVGESSEEEDTSVNPGEEEIDKGTSVDPDQSDMLSTVKETEEGKDKDIHDQEESRLLRTDIDTGENDMKGSNDKIDLSDESNASGSRSKEESDEHTGASLDEEVKKEATIDEARGDTRMAGDYRAKKPAVKSRKSKKEVVEDNDEEVDVGDLSKLTEDSRNILFGRGLVYERAGKKNCALKCYLSCLSHLSQQSNFVLLPQCLRNIADLYYRKEQYEKAILFIQAEKLFYENALIDTSEVQQKIEALREGLETAEGSRSSEDAKIAADSLRADEYEHLAKLCVDKKQPQLALEYAGKATKLRQKIFGNDNPITKESLDFFATLYAEVGKQQYSDSMTTLSEPGDESAESASPVVTPSMERSPSSILRQRKTGDSESERKKQVRFQEPDQSDSANGDSQRENEEFISRTLLWMLFLICSLLLCFLGVWLLCSLTESLTCKWVSGHVQHFFMRIKYYYYQYASTKKVKYM